MTRAVRGIVLRESMANNLLPEGLPVHVRRAYPYLVDGRYPVEVLDITMDSDQCEHVAKKLSAALRPTGYYAHIIDGDEMIICFPDTVVRIRRGDDVSQEHARVIGVACGIPRHQMRFEALFFEDHPKFSPPTVES